MSDSAPMAGVASDAGKRPIAITIICIIGIVGVLFTIPLIVSPEASRVAPWYPPLLAASAVIGLACMVGLWLMRRWAVFVYTGLAVLSQIVLFASGHWSAVSVIIPAIIIVIMFLYLRRMR